MTDLRREFRLTAERGAKIYATVEAVINGFATVRLANGGARMTSLPILGATVAVGDTVIVDYSAEGKPYVRPITVPYEDTQLEQADEFFSEVEETVDDDLVIARITRSTPYNWYTDWYCGAGCNPISHILRLDKVIYDPAGMHNGTYGLVATQPGRYLIRWAAAISPPAPPYPNGLRLMISPILYGSVGRMGGARWRRWTSDSANDWILMSGAIVFTIDGPEDGTVCIRLQPEWGNQIIVGNEPESEYTILVDEGRYPILEMYKLCGIGSGDKAQREWYWNE